MWEERIKNEVWYTDNFVDEELVEEVLEKIKNSDTKELDGNEQPHIISKSYYNYNHIKYNIHENSKLVVQIITKLNAMSKWKIIISTLRLHTLLDKDAIGRLMNVLAVSSACRFEILLTGTALYHPPIFCKDVRDLVLIYA